MTSPSGISAGGDTTLLVLMWNATRCTKFLIGVFPKN